MSCSCGGQLIEEIEGDSISRTCQGCGRRTAPLSDNSEFSGITDEEFYRRKVSVESDTPPPKEQDSSPASMESRVVYLVLSVVILLVWAALMVGYHEELTFQSVFLGFLIAAIGTFVVLGSIANLVVNWRGVMVIIVLAGIINIVFSIPNCSKMAGHEDDAGYPSRL